MCHEEINVVLFDTQILDVSLRIDKRNKISGNNPTFKVCVAHLSIVATSIDVETRDIACCVCRMRVECCRIDVEAHELAWELVQAWEC